MRARRGVSLFEAVIALTIVVMTGISALAASAAEMHTAVRARRAHELSALATERLVHMWLMTDRDLQALPDSVSKGTFDYPLEEYSWTTSSSTNSSLAGLYDIEVTIYWIENGQTNSYTVSSEQYRRPAIATGGR